MNLEKNYLSTENCYWKFNSSLKRLAEVSDIAKMYFTQNTLYLANVDETHHFTTTGKYGIIPNKGYFLGFDSNYLMWYEGQYDGMADEKFPICYNCIYLYGVTSKGIQSLLLAFSTHPYANETIVFKVGKDVDIRRVDYRSQGNYRILTDKEPTLHERYIITKKNTEEVLDDLGGYCARTPEKAIKHYNYVNNNYCEQMMELEVKIDDDNMAYEIKKEELDRSFSILSEYSDVAKMYFNSKYKLTIREVDPEYEYFHPTGKYGCIELQNSKIYHMFDLESDYLMWTEGWHEFYYANEDDEQFIENCMYIFCNCKGRLTSLMIIFTLR